MASPTDIRAGRAYVEITTRNTGLEKGLKSAQTRLRAFGQGLQSIGTKVFSGGLLAGLPLAISAQTFATFEQQMARVRALTGATGPVFEQLQERAQELGRSTVFSASQAAEAMSFFALAGFDVQQILRAIGPTLDLAATGQIEIAQAADIAAKIMAGMGLEANQLGHAVDVMAKAMTTANTDLEMLGDAMKFVGPIAKSAGRSLEETVAIIQALSNAGIQAEMAGTTLRGILLSLASPSSEAEQELKRLGVRINDAQGNVRPLADIIDDLNGSLAGLGSGQKLNILGKIFPARQAAGAAELLSQGGDQIRKFQESLEQSGGTAARIAGVQLNTLSGDVTILKSALEGVGIAIGESFSRPLRGSIKLITGFISTLGRWISANRGIVTAIAVTVAAAIAVGGVLVAAGVGAQVLAFAFGGLATAVGVITSVLGAVLSPVGLLIAGIAALGTAIITYTDAGGAAVSWLGEQFTRLRDFATAALGGVSDALASGDTELAARILWLSLKAAWQQGIGTLEKLWTQFQGNSFRLWEETTSGIAIMLTDAWSGLQSFWEDFTFDMARAWQQFTALVVVGWDRAAALVAKGLAHLQGLFDESLDVEAQIQAIEEASRATQRGSINEAQAAIDAREKERDAAKQAIEQERQARQDVLAESLAAALQAQQTETDSALAQTEAEIAAARKELNDLIAEARSQRELTDAELTSSKAGGLPGVPKIPTADELTTLADEKLSVTGTFNAAVAERLGAQGNEPVVRVLEEVRELNRQILGEARDGGIVFA